MGFKLLESGKKIYLDAGFVMTANTELTITFKKPDDSVVTKTKPNVVLETVNAVLPVIGAVTANEYVSYAIEAGFLDQAGDWCAYLTYTDDTKTPDDFFKGSQFPFTVGDPDCPDN